MRLLILSYWLPKMQLDVKKMSVNAYQGDPIGRAWESVHFGKVFWNITGTFSTK
jgi:hypothetical protein